MNVLNFNEDKRSPIPLILVIGRRANEETGKYLGCLEVSQDITVIQNLNGEKRLDGHYLTLYKYENQVGKVVIQS